MKKESFIQSVLMSASIVFFLMVTLTEADVHENPSEIPLIRDDGTYAERFRVLGDFNCDGIEDMALSIDTKMFGQSGIEMIIFLQDSSGSFLEYDTIFAKPELIATERTISNPRLWIYGRINAQSGILGYSEVLRDSLSDFMSLKIYPGDGGSAIGNALLNAVLNNSDIELKVEKSTTVDGKVKWNSSDLQK